MLEYDSPSNDEESTYDETVCDVGEISSLEGEANFLFGRVSRFGRNIRFKSRICLVTFSFFSLLWEYGIAVTFCFCMLLLTLLFVSLILTGLYRCSFP